MKSVAFLFDFVRRAWRRLRMHILRPLFGSYGAGFWFDPDGCYAHFRNIHVGDDVSLGMRPVMLAALSEIRIGSHVMFGPEVIVVGGGHNLNAPGQFMKSVHEKTGNEDLGVVIEDDVWVGARAMILRGVRVGRGSVIGGASVVSKSVPPYAIVAGNPARVVKFKWDVETILRHEAALYPPEARFSRTDLEAWSTSREMLPPIRRE